MTVPTNNEQPFRRLIQGRPSQLVKETGFNHSDIQIRLPITADYQHQNIDQMTGAFDSAWRASRVRDLFALQALLRDTLTKMPGAEQAMIPIVLTG